MRAAGWSKTGPEIRVSGRRMTMTWQLVWRAAVSLASMPPTRPLSLVTITPIPKRRMEARFSSTEKGPRPAMIRSSGIPAARQASSDSRVSRTRTMHGTPVRRAASA
jgi:hypothetical protein